MPRLLIEGGMIVPMDARDHVIENGIVAIEDDRIVHVSAADEFDQRLLARMRQSQRADVPSCPASLTLISI